MCIISYFHAFKSFRDIICQKPLRFGRQYFRKIICLQLKENIKSMWEGVYYGKFYLSTFRSSRQSVGIMSFIQTDNISVMFFNNH